MFLRTLTISAFIFITSCTSIFGYELPVKDPDPNLKVDFNKHVLPALRQNCIACHNQKEAENDLVLETVEAILKGGGEGPAVVPGKPAESLLWQLSVHTEEPIMPPEDNAANAKNLTPEQLGLLKQWIVQGAKASTSLATVVKMEKLPSGINPVYSLAVSPNGQYLAAGRANQISIYHIPSKREVTRLTDPSLIKSGIYKNPGVAHLDIVQSIAFSPDNKTIASGGYKTLKLWKRTASLNPVAPQNFEQPITSLTELADKKIAYGLANGTVEIRDPAGKSLAKITAHKGTVTSIAQAKDRLITSGEDKTIKFWNLADGKESNPALTAAFPVRSIVLASNQALLIIAGDSKSMQSFDAAKLLARTKPEEEIKPLKTFNGHSNNVNEIGIASADQKIIYSASQDGTVRTFNVDGGNQIRQFSHGQPIKSVAINADFSRLATIGNGTEIKLWNVADGKLVATMKGNLNAQLHLNRSSRHLKLQQRYVQLAKSDLDAQNKRKTAEEANVKKTEEALKKALEEQKKKVAAFMTADKNKKAADTELATKKTEFAAAQKALTDLDAKIKTLTADLNAKKAAVPNLNTTFESSKVALAAANQAKQAADKKLAADAKNAELKKQADAATAAIKPATDAMNAAKAALDAANAAVKTATDLLAKTNAEKNTAKQKNDAAQRAVTAAEQKVKAQDAPFKKAMSEKTTADRNASNSQRNVDRAKKTVANVVAEIPKFTEAIKTAEANQKAANDANAASQKQFNDLNKPFNAVAFDATGKSLWTTAENNRITQWDTATGSAIDSFEFATPAKLTKTNNQLAAISKDGKQLTKLSPTDQWSLAKTIGSIKTAEFEDRVTAIGFNSTGSQIVTGGGQPSRNGEVKIWNAENGALIKNIPDVHSDTVLGVAFSPDDKKIATCAADRFARMVDIQSGKVLRTFEGHTHHVMAVSWSADGRLIASSGADKVVKVWNALTGEQRFTIGGFGKEVTSVRFVELRNQVVCACGDASVRLNEATNNRQIRRYGGFSDFVYCADISADGKTYVAGGHDSIVRVWEENGKLLTQFAPK